MRDAPDVLHPGGAQTRGSSVERAISRLAERQHGVVARRQLLAAGVGRRGVAHRLGDGRLIAVYRGVYAVGHLALRQEGRWMAAVLAAGPGAVLSHRSAAALWEIGVGGPLEVTVPVERRTHGMRIHTSPLAGDEVTELDGIPVTTVARTILDLAAIWPAHRVERAMHEAEVRRLAGPTSLAALLERHPRRRGTPALRAIVARGAQPTRSELESTFLAFLDAHRLPRPATNIRVVGHEVDCAWRTQRLIVELDGHGTHATRRKFESDRARDRALQAAGWRVIRITWRQMNEEAGGLAADLLTLLDEKAVPLTAT